MLALGDYPVNATVDFHFTTHAADGTPTALSAGAVQAYKTNSATPTSSGLTIDLNFNSVTGLNHVRVTTASDTTFYAAGCDISVIISAGTVGGVSAVGYVVGRFSLGRTQLGTAGLDSVVVESGLNARQALSLIAAAGAGDITAVDNGGGTWTFTIKGAGVATTRITAAANSATKARDTTLSPPS